MIPLSVPNISGNEWKYIKGCLDTGWVSSAGKLVETFEKDICRFNRAKYAVSCINGTSGLQVALRVAGVVPGDEVIVPTLTFIAPVNAVRYLYAEPIFMDCDQYLNIDTEKILQFIKLECKLTSLGLQNKKTKRIIKAIVPVHIFGNPCDMAGIMKIAEKFKLKVIEDATESLGAYYTKGKFKGCFTGTIGDLGVYSFNGNKIITTGGGGMILARDPESATKARYLIGQAKDDPVRYIHNQVGYNFALTNIQAAMGVAQLERLKDFIVIKKRNYNYYKNKLRGVPGLTILGIPQNTSPNYWFYSLFIDKDKFGMDREEMMDKLSAQGIQTRPLWFLSHKQEPYQKNKAYKIEKAKWFWERVLNLPCSTNLNESMVDKVVEAIKGLRK